MVCMHTCQAALLTNTVSEGEHIIFDVANGGAGLVLLGHDAQTNPRFFWNVALPIRAASKYRA
jgi:hypothetical protein